MSTLVHSLEDYVRSQVMNEPQADVLRQTVRGHKNILVVGRTSSGKTTLINAILAEITRARAHARFLILEDIPELQCGAQNTTRYCSTSHKTTTQQLLRSSLQMRPDILIVGEIRGAEARDLLDAWATDHCRGGAASIHGDSAADGVNRLVRLVTKASRTETRKLVSPLVADAIDVVVNIQRAEQGRRVKEILALSGYAQGTFCFERLA